MRRLGDDRFIPQKILLHIIKSRSQFFVSLKRLKSILRYANPNEKLLFLKSTFLYCVYSCFLLEHQFFFIVFWWSAKKGRLKGKSSSQKIHISVGISSSGAQNWFHSFYNATFYDAKHSLYNAKQYFRGISLVLSYLYSIFFDPFSAWNDTSKNTIIIVIIIIHQ